MTIESNIVPEPDEVPYRAPDGAKSDKPVLIVAGSHGVGPDNDCACPDTIVAEVVIPDSSLPTDLE